MQEKKYPSNSELADLFLVAMQKRRSLLSSRTNAFRLINGVGDGLPGLTLDKLNGHYQIQIFDAPAFQFVDPLFAFLCESQSDLEFLAVKTRISPSGAALENPEMQILMGTEEDSKTIVQEGKLLFDVDLMDTINPGLFLDMRENRKLFQKSLLQFKTQSANKLKMLNLFSYTCSFGAYGAAAGWETTNVDISAKILDKGRRNYQLNDFNTEEHAFIRRDSGEYLLACEKAGKLFDGIVLDPPSFSRHKKKVFSVKNNMIDLLVGSMKISSPKALLLVSTNYSEFDTHILEKQLKTACEKTGRRVVRFAKSGSSSDFPSNKKMKESSLSVLRAETELLK